MRVGKISDLEVTADNKAAVTISIDDPGYQDFRSDAQCKIRPQSLIGEEFIDCTPTQPRAQGEPLPPPLEQLENGDRAAAGEQHERERRPRPDRRTRCGCPSASG